MSYVVSEDGTRIAFQRLGTGPPLVIVHGGLGSAQRWAAVAERLADRYELLVVDRRGRGGSDAGTAHSLDAEVADVHAVLAAAGTGTALLGHSYGGAVSVEAALTAPPGAIRQLVLYEPATPSAFNAARAKRMLALGAQRDPDALLANGLAEIVGAGLISRQELDETLTLRGTSAWDELANVAWTLPREVASLVGRTPWNAKRLANVSMPTLVVVGELSPEPQTRACRALAEALPNAELVQLTGQAHVAHQADPDQLTRAVAVFLSSTAPPSPRSQPG